MTTATIEKINLGTFPYSGRVQVSFNLNSMGLTDEVQSAVPYVQIYRKTDINTASGLAIDAMVYARSYSTDLNTCSVEIECVEGTSGYDYWLLVLPTLTSLRKYPIFSYFTIEKPIDNLNW